MKLVKEKSVFVRPNIYEINVLSALSEKMSWVRYLLPAFF
jgi:hypothetical protein